MTNFIEAKVRLLLSVNFASLYIGLAKIQLQVSWCRRLFVSLENGRMKGVLSVQLCIVAQKHKLGK